MSPAERPLSPHLQIYRPQLTSALSAGSIALVWWLVAAAAGDRAFAAAQAFWGSWLGMLLLLGWTFSLFFHLCNGIRHLAWDTGYGFDLKQVYFTGWVVVGASAGLTVLAWIAGLAFWSHA
jgi:succinate dehydrogenase / fumarate reductase, cytochrome b subunit